MNLKINTLANTLQTNKHVKALLIIMLVISVGLLFRYSNRSHAQIEKENTVPPEKETIKVINSYTVRSPEIPKEVTFGGDKVPVEYFDVRESLDRELMSVMYWHSNTMWAIKKAYRFFPVIEPILKENKIPEDFKYLALAESGLENAVSPAGAAGFWQFLKSTALRYKLEVSTDVDERYHLEKATHAACEYLNRSYDKYKDWAMVAAAYNYGQGNVDNQKKRQDNENYYDMLWNTETGRYVYRILAYKLIMETPEKYGFDLKKEDMFPPIPTYEVKVDTMVKSWATFAEKYNTNYKVLKYFNPWLRQSDLKNYSKKTYMIALPEKNCRNIDTIWSKLDQ